jgi:hypothetical protein
MNQPSRRKCSLSKWHTCICHSNQPCSSSTVDALGMQGTTHGRHEAHI